MTPRISLNPSGQLSRCVRKLAGPLALLVSPLLVQAQSTVQWSTNYYPVTGATYSEIRQSIARSRPWLAETGMDASTVWRVEWRARMIPTEDGCQCDSIATRTMVTFTLPRWAVPTNASLAVKQQWARYFTALRQHELGHAQFGMVAAAETVTRVQALGPDTDCDRLRKTIAELARRIVDDYRQREKDYDERTAHGTRQVLAPRPATAAPQIQRDS